MYEAGEPEQERKTQLPQNYRHGEEWSQTQTQRLFPGGQMPYCFPGGMDGHGQTPGRVTSYLICSGNTGVS